MTSKSASTPAPAPQPTLFNQPMQSHIEDIPLELIRPPLATQIKQSVGKIGILQPILGMF